MEINNLESECNVMHERMLELKAAPSILTCDRGGIGILAHAAFPEFEGEYQSAPFLMLNLCTAQIGRIRRAGDGPLLEGMLRPGTFALALPGTCATGYWPKTSMLGVAVNLDTFNTLIEKPYKTDSFIAAASQLHNDSLLTAVMTAMWRDAEVHGLSSAFFEQGISVLLKHLEEFSLKRTAGRYIYPLKNYRLKQVLDFIESRLSDDISLSELAALTGQDVRSFSRSFSAAMGCAPYAYFTMRRIEYAKTLMLSQPLSITEIALHVGYANPSKFSAAFRRVAGLAPSVWRRKVKTTIR